jgi:hypothetical protein
MARPPVARQSRAAATGLPQWSQAAAHPARRPGAGWAGLAARNQVRRLPHACAPRSRRRSAAHAHRARQPEATHISENRSRIVSRGRHRTAICRDLVATLRIGDYPASPKPRCGTRIPGRATSTNTRIFGKPEALSARFRKTALWDSRRRQNMHTRYGKGASIYG